MNKSVSFTNKLIDELNDHLNDKINLDKITLLITKEFINLIDFELGIPGILKGSSIGYKLYKLLVKSYGYISSDKNSSDEAKNLWWNLIIDDELYCIASRCFCAIISKMVSNSLLREVLDKIKHNNWKETVDEIQFDDDTRAKIDELYGSFGNYRN